MTASKRETWKKTLANISKEVGKDFAGDARTDQLNAAIQTALMAVDNLHDYPQYVLPNA